MKKEALIGAEARKRRSWACEEDVGWIGACVGEDGGEVGEADNCTST